MTTYEVSVSNYFDADDPEDAVRQAIAWLVDYAPSVGYRVTREYTDEYIGDDLRAPDTWFIDADDLEPQEEA
jgi:hypothetical protein